MKTVRHSLCVCLTAQAFACAAAPTPTRVDLGPIPPDQIGSSDALAVVAFALHGNARDEDVFAFFDAARAAGLAATKVDESQLALFDGLDAKRALVHVYVLTSGLPRLGLAGTVTEA